MAQFKFFLTLLIATIYLSACSSRSTDVASRVEYWEKELNKFIIPGKNIEEIKSWLEFKELEYSINEKNSIYVKLENISAEEWFCNFWQVNSEIYFNVSHKINYFEITTAGQCL